MKNIKEIKAGDLKINPQKIDWEDGKMDLIIEAEWYAMQEFSKHAATILEQAGKEPSDMQKENSERAFRKAFREALQGAEEEAPVVVEVLNNVLSNWEAWFRPYDRAAIDIEVSLTDIEGMSEEKALIWVMMHHLYLPSDIIDAVDVEKSLARMQEMAIEEWKYWHGTPESQIKIKAKVTASDPAKAPQTEAERELQNAHMEAFYLLDWYVPKEGIANSKEVTDWVRETQQ